MTGFKRSLKRMVPEKIQAIIRVFRFPATRYAFFSGPLTYNQDGLTTDHNCDFMDEPQFKEAYDLGKRTGSWTGSDLRWRAHVVCWAAQRAQNLPGDFVECGVNRGGYSRMVVHYVNFARLPKTFYLLDTF